MELTELQKEQGITLHRVPVRNQYNRDVPEEECETKIIARDKEGKMIRLGPQKINPREVTAVWNEALLDVDSRDKDKRLKLQVLFDRLYEAATDMDPNVRTAMVKANETLLTRCIGKPSPSPEVLDSISNGSGIKVLIMNSPAVQKGTVRDVNQKLVPEFCESEVVADKE